MQSPVAIARTRNGIRHEGYLVQITVAAVKALDVCPDGRPWLLGFAKRAVIPRLGSWKGRGSPKTIFSPSVRVMTMTVATAKTSELVQSYDDFLNAYR